MGYTLGEAARFSGLPKSTLSRAISRGDLKASKGENGSYDIGTEELGRFLATVKTQPSQKPVAERSGTADGTHETPAATPSDGGKIALLEQQIEHLEERNKDKDGVIDDLRHRLDREGEERRALTRQLVDAREKETPPPRKTGWWDRLLGRG